MPSPIQRFLKDTYSVGGLHRLEFSDENFLTMEAVEAWLKNHSYGLEDDAITQSGNRFIAIVRRESKFEDGTPRFSPLPMGDGVTAYIGVPLQKEPVPPKKLSKPIEGGPITPETVDVDALVEKQAPTAEMTDEEAQTAQGQRAGRFGVEVLEGSALRFPAGYPTDLEDYGDPCLVGETLVYTTDGPKRIDEIRVGDSVFSLQWEPAVEKLTAKRIRARVVPASVVGWQQTGVKDVLRIGTCEGTIRATSNHPFLVLQVPNGLGTTDSRKLVWKHAGDLRLGDRLVMADPLPGTKKISTELARVLGFYVGDGWLDRQYWDTKKGRNSNYHRVQFACADMEEAGKYAAILRTEFPDATVSIKDHPKNRCKLLQLNSSKYARQFVNFGVTGTAKTKTVPSWVFQATRDVAEAFLDGYIDADGYRQNREGRSRIYRVTSAGYSLIQGIKTLARYVGWSTTNIYTAECSNEHLDGGKGTTVHYDLVLYPDRKPKNMNGKTPIFTSDTTGVRIRQITDIHLDGTEPVYDIQVDGTENFIADGFVVHNCNLQYPLTPIGRLKNALSRFAGNYEEYKNARSRKVVFSRIVDRALKAGIVVDPESELVKTLLAPDLKRRVQDAADQAKEVEKSAKTPVLKLDLMGGSINDLLKLIYNAVQAVAPTGVFGTYDSENHYLPGDTFFVGESTLVINNWRDGRYFQADWKRDGETITLDNFTEVKIVTSFESTGEKGTELIIRNVIEKMDLSGRSVQQISEEIERAIRTAARMGIFGYTDEDYAPVYMAALFDTQVVAKNYHDNKYYRADWSMSKEGVVTLSNITEVRLVETYEEVGPGPVTATLTLSKEFVVSLLDGLEKDRVSKEMEGLAPAIEKLEQSINAIIAPRVKSFKDSDGHVMRMVPIVKIDSPNRIVTYEVYRPYERDTQGDWMNPEEIFKSMAFWMENSQQYDADHDFAQRDAKVVENWQLKEDWESGGKTFPAGTWMQSTRILDTSLWESIEKGEYSYVSIAGTARANPDSKPPTEKSASRKSVAKEDAELTEMQVWKVSFVRRGANSAQGVAPFSVFKSADGFESQALASIFDSVPHTVAESKQSGIIKRALQWLGLSKSEPQPEASNTELDEALSIIREYDDMNLKDLTAFVKESYPKDPAGTLATLESFLESTGTLVKEIKSRQKSGTPETTETVTPEKAGASCPKCASANGAGAKYCSACGASMSAAGKEEKEKEAAPPPAPAEDLTKTIESAVKAATAPLMDEVAKLKQTTQDLASKNESLKNAKEQAEKDAQKRADLLKEAGLGGSVGSTGGESGERIQTTKSEENPWDEVEKIGRQTRDRDRASRLRGSVEKSDTTGNGWDD